MSTPPTTPTTPSTPPTSDAPTPDAPTPDATGAPRSLPLLLAAAGLVVAVTVAVLVFGVTRPPALELLADHPDDAPTEALAWYAWGGDGPCLGVAWPDATTTRPYCDDQGGELLGWVDDDTVLLASWRPDARAIEVDVRDGSIQGTRPHPDPGGRDRTTTRSLTVTRDDEELIVVGTDGTQLWRVQAPTPYRIEWSTVAPDGRHAAFADNADRLLVVATDGGTPPRIWAQDVPGFPEPAWASERVDEQLR